MDTMDRNQRLWLDPVIEAAAQSPATKAFNMGILQRGWVWACPAAKLPVHAFSADLAGFPAPDFLLQLLTHEALHQPTYTFHASGHIFVVNLTMANRRQIKHHT